MAQGDNFKRETSHFVKKLKDPMHMMNSYFEHRETFLENQNVMIDGERFEYSTAFRAATEDATSTKAELKRIYLKTS